MITERERVILREAGEYVVQKLRFDIFNKRVTKYGEVNASGNLADSLRYEVDDRGLRVYAADYVFYTNYGRGPGKFPPLDQIKFWIEDKRIDYSDITLDSLAFLIGRKIARQGTEAFKQGGTDLLEDVINENFIEDVKQQLGGSIIKQIRSDILDAFAA